MLDQLALAIDVLETNALVIDHVIAYARWLTPGLAAAGAWWAGHQTVCWVRARYAACRTARDEARRIARETVLLHRVGQHLADVLAADAELDRRLQRLADDTRHDGQQ